jgi:hypothetical protein
LFQYWPFHFFYVIMKYWYPVALIVVIIRKQWLRLYAKLDFSFLFFFFKSHVETKQKCFWFRCFWCLQIFFFLVRLGCDWNKSLNVVSDTLSADFLSSNDEDCRNTRSEITISWDNFRLPEGRNVRYCPHLLLCLNIECYNFLTLLFHLIHVSCKKWYKYHCFCGLGRYDITNLFFLMNENQFYINNCNPLQSARKKEKAEIRFWNILQNLNSQNHCKTKQKPTKQPIP